MEEEEEGRQAGRQAGRQGGMEDDDAALGYAMKL
jgi:hypothetical protein